MGKEKKKHNSGILIMIFIGVGAFIGSFVGVLTFPRLLLMAVGVGMLGGLIAKASISKGDNE